VQRSYVLYAQSYNAGERPRVDILSSGHMFECHMGCHAYVCNSSWLWWSNQLSELFFNTCECVMIWVRFAVCAALCNLQCHMSSCDIYPAVMNG